MDLTEPTLSVIPGVTGSVLAVLARSSEPLTGRAVAERAKPKASQKGVALVLAHLVEAGVVDRVDKGRSGLFSLNRDHLAAPAVVAIASMRERCLAELRSTIGAWDPKPVSAIVFGSFARGDGATSSDIDLLLVAPANPVNRWREQVVDLTVSVGRWTGNPLNVIEISEHDVAAYAEEAFVRSAVDEGITVGAVTLRQVLRRLSAPR